MHFSSIVIITIHGRTNNALVPLQLVAPEQMHTPAVHHIASNLANYRPNFVSAGKALQNFDFLTPLTLIPDIYFLSNLQFAFLDSNIIVLHFRLFYWNEQVEMGKHFRVPFQNINRA